MREHRSKGKSPLDANPDLEEQPEDAPFYWNFLEMEFDPRLEDATIALRVRNMLDAPDEKPRGGGSLLTTASETGRAISCRLPAIQNLPGADVRFATVSGRPLRGIRSTPAGTIPVTGLVGIPPGAKILMTAFDGLRTESQVIQTLSAS